MEHVRAKTANDDTGVQARLAFFQAVMQQTIKVTNQSCFHFTQLIFYFFHLVVPSNDSEAYLSQSCVTAQHL